MRRMCAAILILALLGLLTACGSRPDSGTRMALVAKAMDSEFWLAMKEGAEAAAREAGIDLTVLAPQREIYIHEQVNILEDQLVRGVDALLVAPAGVAQVIPVLERAQRQGVPVVIVDTDIEWAGKVAYVGTDNREGGRLAAEFIVRRLNGKGSVALIRGIPGVASQEHRVEGFLKEIEKHPGVELVAHQPGNSERALAMSAMENILSANPQLEAVFATSDEMALGVVEAVAAQNRQGKIAVVGFDAGREALKALQERRIHAIVSQNPGLMGRLSVETARKALEGERVDAVVDSGTELVTPENLEEFNARRSTQGGGK